MKPSRVLAGVAAAAVVAATALLSSGPAVAFGGTSTFGCANGSMVTVDVPEGVDRVSISAGGGSGSTGQDGSSRFGKGALVEGTWPVTPGTKVQLVVGCAAQGQTGGVGYSDGGNGGRSTWYNHGGGGGGSTYVGLLENGLARPLVVAGGGGGGGGAGYGNDGGHGTDAGPGTEVDDDYWEAEDGWKSRGGGGGGGAGAGAAQNQLARPGTPGHGGSRWGDWGGAGEGGTTFIAAQGVTDKREVRGGAPAGSGFVLLTFLEENGIVPVTTSFACSNGVAQTYTVPANVYRLRLVAVGGAGSSAFYYARGGEGAYASGELAVTPGQRLGVVAGCMGVDSSGGAGWADGGDGGDGPAAAEDLNVYGGGGGGATAVLTADGTPLLVAGGGGGVGGTENRSPSDGGPAGTIGEPGYPGFNSDGGAGGQGGFRDDHDGSDGSNAPISAAGGGGGGGWRGGQGGFRGDPNGGGGGGGSSYASASIESASINRIGGGGNGNGFVLILAIVANPPGPVVNATIRPDNESVVVAWDAPLSDGRSAIRSYRVLDEAGAVVRTVTAPGSYTIGPIPNGRPVSYSIVAVNAVGTSTPVTLSATPRTVPNAPGFSLVFARQGVRADITPPAFTGGAPVTGYRLYELTTGRFWDGDTSIMATGLTPGQEYRFQVVAINEAGESARSVTKSETPRWYPDAPSITAVYPESGGGAQVVYTLGNAWGAAIVSVTVTATPQGGGAPVVVTGPPSGELIVPGLTSGVPYTFVMRATNSVGASPIPSASYGPVTPSDAPGSPINVVATPGDGQIVLTWNEPVDLGPYPPVLEYRIYDVEGNQIAATADGTPQATITGLTNGVEYGFAVRARTAGGAGELSAYAFATPVPRPANDLEVNATFLTWTDAPGSTGGTTRYATLSDGETPPTGGTGHTIWYLLSVNPGHGGALAIDLCDSPTGAVMTVNGVDATGTEFACPGGGSAPRFVTDYPVDGIDLLIQVDATGDPGDIQLRWRPFD